MANCESEGEESSSSSSTSSSEDWWKYDVFLSFRGSDTRVSFTDHLYHALVNEGFSTFRDREELERGEEIGSKLLKAIEESRISIVVFSENYAASTWCLQELSKIMECRRTLKHIVLPVFYNVDPSHVRSQSRGTYAQAFARHQERFGEDGQLQLQMWRASLTQAANLSGWHSQNWYEWELIQSIIEAVENKLYPGGLDVLEMLSEEVVGYAEVLPLVLETLCSSLSDKTIPEWISELKKSKKIPRDDVEGKLRQRFDSLDAEQQALFINIAYFFVGMERDLPMRMLEDSAETVGDIISDFSDILLLNLEDSAEKVLQHSAEKVRNILSDVSDDVDELLEEFED